ncbi:MAG: type IV pili methyl-accepting chemotaxis transducer N-terminal domain-containing protein, partial [Pseudomonadota bacterium]|nr:type IV pili methyl-accepting chemotaxis transducer N-terminal domain-containing protein [Pseudomonadota bacterium]
MKNYVRYTGFIILALSMLAPAAKAQAEITSVSDGINKAGRQRMLTQRIVKDFCLIGQDVAAEPASKELKKSISLFEKQLKELKAFTPTEKIKQRVSTVDMEWGPFRKMAEGKSGKESCRALNEAGEDLLRNSHKIVLAL